MRTGSFSQPRTVEVRARTALSQSTSQLGQRRFIRQAQPQQNGNGQAQPAGAGGEDEEQEPAPEEFEDDEESEDEVPHAILRGSERMRCLVSA